MFTARGLLGLLVSARRMDNVLSDTHGGDLVHNRTLEPTHSPTQILFHIEGKFS
jgi:hypothetical protein